MQTRQLSGLAQKQQSQLKKPVTQTPVKRTPITTNPIAQPTQVMQTPQVNSTPQFKLNPSSSVLLPRQNAMQNIMKRKLTPTSENKFRFANPGVPAQPQQQNANPYMQRILQMMQLGGQANGRLY